MESDLDARIKAHDSIARDFEDAVERIISRHYNKILLEKMADNVRAVTREPVRARPRQTGIAVPAVPRASARVVVVAPPAPVAVANSYAGEEAW